MASDTYIRDPLLRAAAELKNPPVVARPFIHLRVHSAYSLLEGALQLPKIVDHAVADHAPAIADSDLVGQIARILMQAIVQGRLPPGSKVVEAGIARELGVSFTGSACSEPRLIELAYAFEQATRRRVPPPDMP